MIGFTKRITAAALLLLGAGGSLGCELLATVDRSKIVETGVGGSGGTGGSTGGTGGTAGTCGNGQFDLGEECEDGNATAGDGCSATCTVEPGYTCGGFPSVCTPICGDGLKLAGEACDDGNTISSDGCDPDCKIEAGWGCTGEPSVCTTTCGDGIKAGFEECDDKNTVAGDGCDPSCEIETGYSCVGQPSVCTTGCGDGVIAGSEACDDGNLLDGDGCSAACALEPGFLCSGTPTVCAPICGDGLKVSFEECDDGNTASGDGCDLGCEIEVGWTCAGAPSACSTVCGDGLVVGGEGCDDGDTVGGDGCSATCTVETGYTCAGAPSICSTTCGDGITAGAEACDDGGTTSGNGCSATCTIEVGWACAGTPSACAPICGDGKIVGSEACDDGNTAAGDGCNAACHVETGYACAGAPSACAPVCGDGLIVGAEACDDGNSKAGDGCNVACHVEAGWVCAGAPSACHTVCGDGIKAGTEQCDDGNSVNLDGCSTACKTDVFTETEPNDTPATANGPYDHGVLVHGAIQPATDADYFAIVLPATADLHVETFDQAGPGHCANIDTVVSFLAADGTTVLATDDDAGINACSKLDSQTTAAVRHLPAGTYYVKVETYNQWKTIPGYTLEVTFNALCGDGVKAGFEQCDGTPGCAATCDRTPVCGDGHLDGAEQCDDGNAVSGDGCSAACQLEVLGESEPNNSAVQADGPYHPSTLLGGAISPATDVDWFAVQLSATSDLRLETFDVTGPTSCVGIDTVITLYGTDGTTALISRDQGGVNSCSRIDPALALDKAAAHLPAGTYFVKVESHANATVIPGYRLLVTTPAVCGNGVVEGSEECDGSAGCTATCDRTPVCGDGFVDAPETCDDGNTVSGDGCSATCQNELVSETEPNGTSATASGPYSAHALIQGSISPGTDLDFFAIQVTAVSDLKVQTWDGNGPGSCSGQDTVITLYGPDGVTELTNNDDGGIAPCSLLDPKTDAAARHLAPGTYFVKVEDFGNDSVIPSYKLEITFVAVCGNGKVEGSEECDGTANCDATCQRVPTCGDGYVDGAETCDDGNTVSGDGCSATCAVEAVAEVEPNDTTAQADASAAQLTGSATVTGAIGAVGDKDLYRLTLAAPSVVRLETLDPSGVDCTLATTLRLFDSGGTQLYSDDNSGMSTCSALVLNLAAGTYYVGVEQQGNTATLAAYELQVRVEASAGGEVEPNDTSAQATVVSGADVFVLGGHQVNADTDFFAITVPPGKSVRAEVIEGSATETCELLDVDSYLTLYDAGGVALETDDDGGRGFCSRIDGTGDQAANPGASKLPGGTYYLAVEAAPFAQSAGDTSGQFDYRLVITIR
jgi:cysteine-rich repeat protein